MHRDLTSEEVVELFKSPFRGPWLWSDEACECERRLVRIVRSRDDEWVTVAHQCVNAKCPTKAHD